MNKKQLYESIMSSVAKEVKKALLENSYQYLSYHDAELDAIHFNELPEKYKGIIDDEEFVISEKMTRSQLLDFISNINWELLGEQYGNFYPTARSYYEEYIYDYDITKYSGKLYVQVPCSNISMIIKFDLDTKHIPYYQGDQMQPSEGGYDELTGILITGIEIDNNGSTIKLSDNEIISYNLQNIFNDEIYAIAEN